MRRPNQSEVRAKVAQKVHNARNAFTSRQAFIDWVQVPTTVLDEHGHKQGGSTWSNVDLDPTPPEKRTWRWIDYVIFYWALSFGNRQLGATMVGIGLNWWQAILTIFLSQFISSIAMLFNSRCASVYHIGYPVVGRSVFGMLGAYYFVLARAALAIIWFGVQLYSGSALVAIMLRAVFGNSYTSIPNTIPASQGIDSATLLAVFLFWLCHLAIAAFRLYQLRWFFWLKVAVMVPAIFGLFIFCMVNTKGNVGLSHLPETVGGATGGTAWGWFFIWSINSGMGNTATLIVNQPDIARWSKTKTGAMYSQLFTNPIAVTLSASLGILATSAINNNWASAKAQPVWNQWILMNLILDKYWTAGCRTAIFLAAGGWAFSILGTNIAANMVPFGSDVTLLAPRYFTIPRGQFLVACLGFAICPWKILTSAAVFTTFLAGYGLFMASVVAIMVADYWLLTKGNVFVGHLYDGSADNKHYWYHYGFNIQGIIAYLAGISLPFAGFLGTLGVKVSVVAEDLGHLGWLLSFFTSFIIYYLLCLVWPTKNQKIIKQMGLKWEEVSYSEVVAEDGTVITTDLEGKPPSYDVKGDGVYTKDSAVNF